MRLLGMFLMKSCGEFSGRKWNIQDVFAVVMFLALHCLCALAPFHFNWPAFWVAITLYIATGLGVTLCYHRSLAHRSFRLAKWLEYFFAYCGVLSLQGSPIEWVSNHRYHHQLTNTKKDPHSPRQGLWYGYIGWKLDISRLSLSLSRLKNVEDLRKHPFYRFLHRTNCNKGEKRL
ncbi:delta-9 acyl-lipid desaturase 1-like [Prunus avium]|uniref:Delta-9 acyl-lipid desaturase 1-like n=1 Tax=Prunus avium TaxID=42229 RepID=A0A6P5U3Y9_PRUAV|nr:delta-9 acyl-lipid desaturase 1-like [Prunus avium]